jgi:hypothetical protein
VQSLFPGRIVAIEADPVASDADPDAPPPADAGDDGDVPDSG